MKIEWIIEPNEVARAKAFVAEHRGIPFVQNRIKRNLRSNKPPVSKAEVWETHVGCLLTTQQRSGPNSPVSRFMSTPFTLSLEACSSTGDVAEFCRSAFRDFGGLWRSEVISGQVAANFVYLANGGWEPLLEHFDAVRTHQSLDIERQAAEFIDDKLVGFGPKQARNLLQWLGLSRYETPIDSRITRWLNDFGFPFKLSAEALSDRNYYNLVSEGFQKLSLACGVEPCVFDAAIFASYDGDEWTEETVTG